MPAQAGIQPYPARWHKAGLPWPSPSRVEIQPTWACCPVNACPSKLVRWWLCGVGVYPSVLGGAAAWGFEALAEAIHKPAKSLHRIGESQYSPDLRLQI